MGAWLLLSVGAVYLAVAVEYAIAGRYGMALAFAAYALANGGFALDLWR